MMDFSVSATRLLSSAPSMKAAGDIMPCWGWRTRANSSTPDSFLTRRSIFGWYQNSIQSSLSAVSRLTLAEWLTWTSSFCSWMTRLITARSTGFLTGVSMRRSLRSPNCLTLSTGDLGTLAHELERAAVVARQQHAHGFQRRGRHDRNVEKHQIGLAARQALLQRRRGGEQSGFDSMPLQHQRHEMAMLFLFVDDEADGRGGIDVVALGDDGGRLALLRPQPAAEFVDHVPFPEKAAILKVLGQNV